MEGYLPCIDYHFKLPWAILGESKWDTASSVQIPGLVTWPCPRKQPWNPGKHQQRNWDWKIIQETWTLFTSSLKGQHRFMASFTRISQQNFMLPTDRNASLEPGAMPPVLRRLSRSVQRGLQSFFDGTNREVGVPWNMAIYAWFGGSHGWPSLRKPPYGSIQIKVYGVASKELLPSYGFVSLFPVGEPRSE